ncbi:MAG: hypothetical protein PHY93_01175 [Bacteriovorax sp.]|nr:hypothetical protein [Bacteriovorax sp.]
MKDLVFVLVISFTVVAASMLKADSNSQSPKSVVGDQKFISYTN